MPRHAMQRQRTTLAALLCLCSGAAFAQQDPAYVDSAAGRAVPDAARADAGPAMAAGHAGSTTHFDAEAAFAEYMAAAQAPGEAGLAVHATQPMQVQAMQAPGGHGAVDVAVADPPIGGRDLVAEMTRARAMQGGQRQPDAWPSPATQAAAGTPADANGLLDARLHRVGPGSSGQVILPMQPGLP